MVFNSFMLLFRQRGTGWAAASFMRWFVLLLGFLYFQLRGADLDEIRQKFLKGQYDECIKAAEAEASDRFSEEGWRLVLIRSLMEVGRYPDALEATQNALRRFQWSIRLKMLAYDVYLHNGQRDEARGMLDEINNMAGMRSRWITQDPVNLLPLGQAALLLGADPKRVLDVFFDRAKKADPKNRDVYLASGNLALDKNDDALAEKFFSEGLKQFPNDPDLHCGLAKAYESGDRSAMMEEIESALEANTNHVPTHLLLADHLIDAEEYEEASEHLDTVLGVNPWQPDAWALRA